MIIWFDLTDCSSFLVKYHQIWVEANAAPWPYLVFTSFLLVNLNESCHERRLSSSCPPRSSSSPCYIISFCFTPSSCQRQLSLRQQMHFFFPLHGQTNECDHCGSVCHLPPVHIHLSERIHLQSKLLISFYETFDIYMPFIFPSRFLWFYKLLWTDNKSQTWLLLSGISCEFHQLGDKQDGKCVNMKALNILFWSEELKSSGGEQSSYKASYWLFILAMRLMDCFQAEFHLPAQLSDFLRRTTQILKVSRVCILYSHSWGFPPL